MLSFNMARVTPEVPLPTPRPPLSAKYKDSFAYLTVRDRLPVILTKAVDDLCRMHSQRDNGDPVVADAKRIISRISRLKYELQRDRALSRFETDGPDVDAWNCALEDWWAKHENSWFTASWLFVECFMYRRLREIFLESQTLQDYDVFRNQKEDALKSSIESIKRLAAHMNTIQSVQKTQQRDITVEMLQFSLWGNKTDLSLLTDIMHSDFEQLQSTTRDDLNGSSQYIIVDDSERMCDYVSDLSEARVDIVLDNAGFELFADLCLADWFVTSGVASKVILHVKQYPWFVSDATQKDFTWTLSTLLSHSEDTKDESLKTLIGRWNGYLKSKTWSIEAHPFWTLPYSFYQIPTDLFPNSSLVVFKGDLNYRKAVYDCQWKPDTPANEALNPVAQRLESPFLLLRTCKADVVVGLKPGQAERLLETDENWMTNGKWGIVDFYFFSMIVLLISIAGMIQFYKKS